MNYDSFAVCHLPSLREQIWKRSPPLQAMCESQVGIFSSPSPLRKLPCESREGHIFIEPVSSLSTEIPAR